MKIFFRMGAALTISLGAGTGLHFEHTRHCLALSRAFLERKLAQHPLVSLSTSTTTREVCAVAGAQDVVRGILSSLESLWNVVIYL